MHYERCFNGWSGRPSVADEAWHWLKHVLCIGGDCLTSRTEGRSQPWELWFSMYEAISLYVHLC